MAIYKRNYRAYAGPLTPAWSRSWILTRYAWRYLFRSRFMTIFFIVCFFPVLFMALGMYLNHSESLLPGCGIASGFDNGIRSSEVVGQRLHGGHDVGRFRDVDYSDGAQPAGDIKRRGATSEGNHAHAAAR